MESISSLSMLRKFQSKVLYTHNYYNGNSKKSVITDDSKINTEILRLNFG